LKPLPVCEGFNGSRNIPIGNMIQYVEKIYRWSESRTLQEILSDNWIFRCTLADFDLVRTRANCSQNYICPKTPFV